ncbi:hypothetical protein BGZ83_000857 [Gryganskiella cystojenkinii]|nr:hypothetical protein BGZ83_000857 [Gryganskiella cystojenkinii]
MPVGQTLNQGLNGVQNLGQGALSKGKGFFDEYRDFLNKGNAFDLAVAFILATALSAVVKSLVEDIITPIFGLGNNRNLDEMFVVLRCGKTCNYPTRAAAQDDGAVTWNWGRFINTVIYFLMVGLLLFVLVKVYYTARRKTLVKDKPCPYCGKDVAGSAVRCHLCTSWLDQDVRRKFRDDLPPYNPNAAATMSSTTLGTSNGHLREKDSIEVLSDGNRAAGLGAGFGLQQGLNPMNSQLGLGSGLGGGNGSVGISGGLGQNSGSSIHSDLR